MHEELARPVDDVAIGAAAGENTLPRNAVALGFGAVARESNTFVVAWGSPPVQLTIHADGRIDLPPGWTPDAAAQEFWKVLAASVKSMASLMPFIAGGTDS